MSNLFLSYFTDISTTTSIYIFILFVTTIRTKTMTPIEVSGSTEPSVNYAGEAKTECLVLCSGLGALHHHKVNHNQNSPTPHDARPPITNNRLAVLRNSEGPNQNGRNKVQARHSLPVEMAIPNLHSSIANQPHMVKVSVYTKAVNPYLVIYDSNKKYSQPAAYLKLANCLVKSGGPQHNDPEVDNNNDEDDCLFRIFPSKGEDVDVAGIITLRASTKENRDEWVQLLTAVSSGHSWKSKSISSYVPGSSVLPTLVEQDDNTIEDEQTNNCTDSLKAPSRRKRREGRRNSLNSIGMRLRCYTVGKDRLYSSC